MAVKMYVIVCIRTIDFPDGRGCHSIAGMDTNVYALQTLARLRLSDLRDQARCSERLALARGARHGLRVRLGVALIALGERLRRGPDLVPVAQP
jgi:hypothetical protein